MILYKPNCLVQCSASNFVGVILACQKLNMSRFYLFSHDYTNKWDKTDSHEESLRMNWVSLDGKMAECDKVNI